MSQPQSAPKPRFLFVTGTDTGVGKTLVSRALLLSFRRRGLPASACKPLETGVVPGAPELATDAAQLDEAAGQPPGSAAYLRFVTPVAPQAAALAEGRDISIPSLVAECKARAAALTLVEGAGGLLVPIARGFTMADLAAAIDAAVLIVARTRLGTLNHSLLTVAECRRRGLRVLGVVLNRCEPSVGPEERHNLALLKEHSGVEVFGPLPYLDATADADALVAAAESHLPILQLYRGA